MDIVEARLGFPNRASTFQKSYMGVRPFIDGGTIDGLDEVLEQIESDLAGSGYDYSTHKSVISLIH